MRKELKNLTSHPVADLIAKIVHVHGEGKFKPHRKEESKIRKEESKNRINPRKYNQCENLVSILWGFPYLDLWMGGEYGGEEVK